MPPPLPVALLAGGLATRLRPITERIPKLLVEVAGEPFFSHQLRLLKQSGLTHLVVCVGHLGEQIVERYGNGAAWGVHIEYAFDGPRLLGTGGALIRALPRLGEAFYVLYGDSYLPIDYRPVGEHFLRSGKQGLMTVYENRGRYDTSNVWFEDGTIREYNKQRRRPEMHHIDYGLGVFRASAFDGFPRDEPVDLAAVQQALLARGELAGHEIHERFYEIGSPAGLEELNTLLRR
ncbi:MAG TPA: nucleotidyltransferase family protein [Opitutaceae bacterium]|nr:nucleotidyltransferase family protein [Opitutaceae bacterium]HND60517.1 nucleotidyltransferase family protein [Opitutaceae bacterium]